MRRAQRDGIRPVPRRARRKRPERRRIADPAVAFTPQRIELNRQSPQPLVWSDIADAGAATGRHCKRQFAVVEVEAMVPGFVERGDDKRAIRG